MTSTYEFFKDNPWGAISEPCYPDGRRLYLRDERFWVSIDKDSQRLFFVQDSGGAAVKPLENLAGLEVSIEKQANGDNRLVCKLTSTDPEIEDKFATVAKDIAYHCSVFHGTELFLRTQERIKSWANFLRPSRQGLSPSEFRGLFGELYMMAEYLAGVLSAEETIKAWIGPEGKKQDFTLDSWAIEVKTTVSGEQQAITISSLDQLDKVTKKLFLARIVAAPATEGNGLSLRDLYTHCVDAARHDVVSEGLFLRNVSGLYGKASETQLREEFKILSVTLFDVEAAFPRLTRNIVDPGIVAAKYDISVGTLEPFIVHSDLAELLKNE